VFQSGNLSSHNFFHSRKRSLLLNQHAPLCLRRHTRKHAPPRLPFFCSPFFETCSFCEHVPYATTILSFRSRFCRSIILTPVEGSGTCCFSLLFSVVKPPFPPGGLVHIMKNSPPPFGFFCRGFMFPSVLRRFPCPAPAASEFNCYLLLFPCDFCFALRIFPLLRVCLHRVAADLRTLKDSDRRRVFPYSILGLHFFF